MYDEQRLNIRVAQTQQQQQQINEESRIQVTNASFFLRFCNKNQHGNLNCVLKLFENGKLLNKAEGKRLRLRSYHYVHKPNNFAFKTKQSLFSGFFFLSCFFINASSRIHNTKHSIFRLHYKNDGASKFNSLPNKNVWNENYKWLLDLDHF